MAIRTWPVSYDHNDHLTAEEKKLLRLSKRNFADGHFVVDIDPIGFSNPDARMGMYISPENGLLSFTIISADINESILDSYVIYTTNIENQIYERLLDSKMLIVRQGDYKILKFPYKHVLIFPNSLADKVNLKEETINKLLNYATISFFRPISSKGKEKTISELHIFDGIRKPYDKDFKCLSESECKAIFERLAPEYTVVMNETDEVKVPKKQIPAAYHDYTITGEELEYKTFFLDTYQVGLVNEMGKGHRVILANPGAGKSVLLLAKAFKYASANKKDKVLLTCFNSNLADAYLFKRACANFGDNNNLYIMTFHKLVKKIYEECLHTHCESNIATDEEIQQCIKYIKNGKVNLKFKAIFIDEVQIFDPIYLELCYLLLDKESPDHVFLMAGDAL